MKKMGLICAAVLLCGGLAGCGQHKDNSSAKISSLKAENSSLKAKKSSSHKVKHQRKSSSSSQSKNGNNASSTAQTATPAAKKNTNTSSSSVVQSQLEPTSNTEQQSTAPSSNRSFHGPYTIEGGVCGNTPGYYGQGELNKEAADIMRNSINANEMQRLTE